MLGLNKGMVLTSLGLGAAGGLVVFLLMRLVGVARGPALLGQLLYYALPTGYWSTRMLSEGAVLLSTVAVLIGAWLLLQRRFGAGLAVTAAATLFGFVVKSPQVPMLGIALTGAVAGIWIFDRQRRHAGTLVLAACCLAMIGAGLLIPRLLGWPDLDTSLQDSFTHHFQKGPDVADPFSRLIKLNVVYWIQWFQDQALRPMLLLAGVAGAVAMWRWSRSFALIVLAAASTGIAAEVAHPAFTEADRLYVQLWLAAVLGLPLFWPLLLRRRAEATGQPAGSDPVRPDPVVPDPAGPPAGSDPAGSTGDRAGATGVGVASSPG